MTVVGPEAISGGALIVALLSTSDRLGGAERSTVEVAAEDTKEGNPWLILARDTGRGPLQDLCNDLGVPFETAASAAQASLILRARKPSVVWAFGLRWSATLRLVVATGLVRDEQGRRPLLFVAQRGLDVWRRPWHNWFDRSTQRLVDVYVANSIAASDMLVKRVRVDRGRVVAIPTGVSSAWLSTPSPPRPPNDVTRIMVVGNNRPEKALVDAVSILRKLDQGPWTATMFTDEANDLRSLIRLSGLDDRVQVIVGHHLSIDDYDRNDVLLHAARSESLPRAVLEAVARRLTVAATDVGDTASLIDPRGVFAPGDICGGAEALNWAVSFRGQAYDHSNISVRTQAEVARDLRALVASSAFPRGRGAAIATQGP